MMISATSGFVNQSTHYDRNNTGQSLKNYTLLKEGELSYNHGYSKLRNYGSVFTLRVKEARIPFVYHSFSMPNDDSIFYGHYLNSGIFDKDLKRLISSTARMDGLMNISYDEYMGINVYRPSISEQHKIANQLDTMDSLLSLHQRSWTTDPCSNKPGQRSHDQIDVFVLELLDDVEVGSLGCVHG